MLRPGFLVFVAVLAFSANSTAQSGVSCLSVSEQTDLQRRNVATLQTFRSYNFPAMADEYRGLIVTLCREPPLPRPRLRRPLHDELRSRPSVVPSLYAEIGA